MSINIASINSNKFFLIYLLSFLVLITYKHEAWGCGDIYIIPNAPSGLEIKRLGDSDTIQLKWSSDITCDGFEICRDKYDFLNYLTFEWPVVNFAVPDDLPNELTDNTICQFDEDGNEDTDHYYYYDTDHSVNAVYSYCIFSWNHYWHNGKIVKDAYIWSNGSDIQSITAGTGEVPRTHSIHTWAPFAWFLGTPVLDLIIQKIRNEDPYYTADYCLDWIPTFGGGNSCGSCTAENCDDFAWDSGISIIDSHTHHNSNGNFLVLLETNNNSNSAQWINGRDLLPTEGSPSAR